MEALVLFVSSAAAATWWQSRSRRKNDSKDEDAQQKRITFVTPENKVLLEAPPEQLRKSSSISSNSKQDAQSHCWCRATYILVMHEPPHLFYEPREWSHTSIMLLKTTTKNNKKLLLSTSSDEKEDVFASADSYYLKLPGGMVLHGESYHDSAVRRLLQDTNIDVCLPENCLHHLFTFPFEYEKDEKSATKDSNDNPQQQQQPPQQPQPQQNQKRPIAGIWGDCYECVYRGTIDELGLPNSVCMTLAELKELLESQETTFAPESRHTLKLYFQRQGDLRAKRRLLKGYSTSELEHYGLRRSGSSFLEHDGKPPLMLLDSFQDNERNAAMDFTMKLDDGMSPRLLYQADVIILGASRTGKTPLSIYISQVAGLKVANVPLVFELQPPQELTDTSDPDKIIDPRRVFCLTRDVEEMEKLRISRIKQALKKSTHKQESTYANFSYIRKDLAKARNYARQHGFTEIDVSDRALEECASIIISKMKERFPDMHIHS